MHYTKSCGGFSLAPSEGERAGERGCSVLSIPRSCQYERKIPSPKGEGWAASNVIGPRRSNGQASLRGAAELAVCWRQRRRERCPNRELGDMRQWLCQW